MAKPLKQQFNVYLTPELIRALKYRVVDSQLSLSDLVQRALEDFLKRETDDHHAKRTRR